MNLTRNTFSQLVGPDLPPAPALLSDAGECSEFTKADEDNLICGPITKSLSDFPGCSSPKNWYEDAVASIRQNSNNDDDAKSKALAFVDKWSRGFPWMYKPEGWE